MSRFKPQQVSKFLDSLTTCANGCVEWSGKSRDFAGYGRLHFRLTNQEKVDIAAHRFSWEISNGPIPYGLFVLHKCDNCRCVNPDHLFLGTQQDNMDDMWVKGRGSYAHGLKKAQEAALSDAAKEKRRNTFRANKHQQGENNSNYGSFWITDGVSSKKWRLSFGVVPEGWSKGRKMQVSPL